MATSVEDFAIQLLEPLKSDDMKRAIFAGKDFDRVVDKAVFYEQKKFVSHPVVYNLLKKRWVGRFHHLKYSSWMELKWWKWIFLNVWAMFDVVLFPVVFLSLYCLHLVIGLLKKRRDVRVILMLNAKWKFASKEFEKMKDLCSSIMDGSGNDGKVMFASIIRYQQQHSISEFKDSATLKADMIQTSALDETTNNFTFMDCLKKAKEMFGSVHKHNSKVLIIMTDDKSDAVMDLELIKDLKDSKTRVLSVGFGIQPEIKELVTMATNDESVFLYNRDINLENLSKQMLKSIKGHDVFDKYTSYFTTPYFIFLRDTISYLALLALHFAMCLQPSTLHLTALEWIVMLFFIGRLMMEINQVIAENDSTHLIVEEQKMRNKRMSGYFSDWWNILDVATLALYSFLFVIRCITWAEHISVSKNRLLAVAGYMYGLNTMFLTLRVFGQIMEFSKSTGSIQIALFQIMGAVIAIFGQFLAAILAFSLVLTKIYVAEVSLNGSDNTTTHGLCADGSQSGLACWWTSAQFLAWSLMGIADLAPLSSSDDTSDMIAKLLYIIFLIMGVIMLMNMMIALLSNTYQQVEDNAFYEWSYRKTTTIRTYSDYHCVPVPFNVISLCWVFLRNVVNTVKRCKKNRNFCKKKRRNKLHELLYSQIEMHFGFCPNKEKQKQTSTVSFFDCLVIDLQNYYFSAYGYTFPMEESTKIDQVLKETDGSHRLIGHIANRVFRYDSMEKQQLQSHGAPEWDTKGIDINGQRLSYRSDCDCNDCWQLDERDRSRYHGAKYLRPLSKQWPGFEVLIQESGERRFVAIGVVSASYELHSFPGWSGNTAGYHIDDGKIFDRKNPKLGLECKDAMAYRGDLIGCRVLYESPQRDGSVSVQFTINGRVIGEGSINTERTSTGVYAFVGIGGEDISLVFRLCPYQHRELQPSDVSTSQLDNITKQIEQIRASLSNQHREMARRQSDIEHKVSLLYDNLMHSRESGGNVNWL